MPIYWISGGDIASPTPVPSTDFHVDDKFSHDSDDDYASLSISGIGVVLKCGAGRDIDMMFTMPPGLSLRDIENSPESGPGAAYCRYK